MKRALLLLLLVLCTLAMGQSASNYRGLSPAQLSAMTDYVTIPNTSYWNSHAYAQLYALFNQIFKIGGDSTGIRFVSMYDNLQMAIQDSTTKPVPGFIFGAPTTTSLVTDTTLCLTSNTELMFPESYTVSWADRSKNDVCGNMLFSVWSDSNITIRGGLFYGHSDDNYVTGNVIAYYDTQTIGVDGLNVVADSLVNWWIHIISGTGTGQCRRIYGNAQTSAGNTAIVTTTPWTTHPDNSSDYRVSPMNQHDAAFSFVNSKHILVDGVQINDFPGDGITIEDCDDVKILNSTIRNPFRYAYAAGYTNGVVDANGIANYVGRQGISVIARNLDYPDCNILHPGDITPAGTCKNIIIDNCKVYGGNPGGIDIEPNDTGTINNVLINNCLIVGGFRGIQIGNTGAAFWNIKVSNTNITDVTNYVVDLTTGSDTRNIEFYNCTFRKANGMYFAGSNNVRFVNCVFDSLGYVSNSVDAAYIVGASTNIEFINCKFNDSYKGAIYAYGTSIENLTVDGCIFTNNGVERADGLGHATIYMNGCKKVKINNNQFYDVTHKYQGDPIHMFNCDSVFISNNISYNNYEDEIYFGTGNTNIFEINNKFGNKDGIVSRYLYNDTLINRVAFMDTLGVGFSGTTSIRVGESIRGDTTASQNHEASRNQIVFSGYRNTEAASVGVKLVGQNYAAYGQPGAECDTCSTSQNSNLIIYTINGKHMEKPDDTERAAIVNKYGVGVNSSGYFSFISDVSDTSWKYIGSDGYGLRDNSGTIEAKNSGGTWMRILQFIGAKNPTYDATVGDLWFSSKRDTLFYQASADSSYYILRDGVVTGKH